MTQSKSLIKNSKLFYMYVALLYIGGRDPEKAGGWGSRVKGVPGNFQNWVQHIDGCL